MKNQNMYLQKLNECSFAFLDSALYCDTHPCDSEAVAYCRQFAERRKEALKEYECNVGPMLMDQVDGCDDWQWINSPWPWEGGNC